MNKSKFLKKSLAALLAVLMVVAMIPLSAAAAEAEVTEISIGNDLATGGPTSWDIKIPAPTAGTTVAAADGTIVNVVLGNHGGVVRHYNDSQTDTAVNSAGNTWQFPMTATEVGDGTKGTIKFEIYDAQGATDTEQVITLNWSVKEGSNDTSLKSVIHRDQYGATSIDTSGANIVYNIVLPYKSTGTQSIVVTPTNSGAKVTGATDNGDGTWTITTAAISDGKTETKFEVKNGTTIQNYVVKTVNASAFATFSVAGERKAAKIDNENRKITVYMPYGTKADANAKLNITPTFTKGYSEVSLTVNDGTNDVALESGKEIDANKYFNNTLSAFTGYAAKLAENGPLGTSTDEESPNASEKFSAIPVTVEYSDNDTEVWIIEFQAPTNDPQPTLKGLKVGNFQAEINEENHTAVLKLPSSLRVADSNTLMGLASKSAKVLIVDMDGIAAQTIAADGTYRYLTCDNDDGTAISSADKSIDLKNRNSYWIRVTAAGDAKGGTTGDKAIQDYRLTIETIETVGEPTLTGMRLEDKDGKVYTAKIENNVVLFDLPFSVYTKANLQDWKLYYDVSSGSAVSTSSIASPSGYTLTNNEAIFPTAFDGTTTGATAIEVSNELGKTEYKIAVKRGAANNTSTMTGFKVTKATKFEDIKDGENTFAAKVNGRDLTVEIPYSEWSNFQTPAIVANLPEGAKMYYLDKAHGDYLTDGNGSGTSYVDTSPNGGLTVLAKDGDTVGANKKLPQVQNTADPRWDYDGVYTPAGASAPQTLTLVVVSQKGATDDTGADKVTSGKTIADILTTGEYTTYNLIIKRAEPSKIALLDGFSVYDTLTKTRIDAQVDSVNNKINLTLPASFVKNTTREGIANGVYRTLYYDHKTSHYESVVPLNDKSADPPATPETGIIAKLDKLVLDDDGARKSGGNAVTQATNTNGTGALFINNTAATDQMKFIRVEAEAYAVGGEAGLAREYELIVKYEEPKKQAVLNSVTINGVTRSPDANGKVSITLPMGTDVTGLRPTFNVSNYGYVTSTNAVATSGNANVLNSGDLMNFTFARKVYVFSEDGSVKRDYTIEVKLDDAFSDVHETDWFYGAVMEAVDKKIILGRGNGIFDPYASVTRAEFATMIARTLGFDKDAAVTNPFSDMQGYTGEVLNAVAWCAEEGYITGYGDTTFKPGKTISRQEMAVIMARVLNLDTEATTTTDFADNGKIASWARGAVAACVNANMLYGESSTVFNPLGNTNRAAAATVVIRIDHAK